MRTTAFLIAAALGAAPAASASVFQWSFTAGQPGQYGINDKGGTIESIEASFDTASQHFSWSVTFADQVTTGMTLAVSGGPNPKGHPGELALLYIDASITDDVKIAAYGYNGKNSKSSYIDGDGDTNGNQAPDLIKGVNESDSWVLAASLEDVGSKRVLSFTVDATDVNAHVPLYGNDIDDDGDIDADDWHGLAFGNALGLWMHPFRSFTAAYEEGGRGAIEALSTGGEGWLDGKDFETVPAPGSIALAAVGGLFAGRRRR